MKAGKLAVLLTAAAMMIFAGTGVSASSAPKDTITVNYDLNGGKDKTTGAGSYTKEYKKDGNGVDLLYPMNIENGDLVFLGWKNADYFDKSYAVLYCESGVYSSFTYRNGHCGYVKDGTTFKALWGKKIKLTFKSGSEHKFKSLEVQDEYVDTLEVGWFKELPYEFRFSIMTPYSSLIYNGDSYMTDSEFWQTNNYYSSDDKAYALTAFKSTKTGKVYDLTDYDFDPSGEETFEAVWTKTVAIDEDYNGGEFLLYGNRKEPATDYVPAGRNYYVYYNNPKIHFDFVARDDIEIIKPGYKLTGWKSSADGKVYKQNDKYVPTKDTLFTAVWEKCGEGEDEGAKLYGLTTVRYDANGGEFTDGFKGRLLSNEEKSMRAFYGNLMISEYKKATDTLNTPAKDVKYPVGYFVGDSKLFYEHYDEEKYKSPEDYKAKVTDKLPMKEAFEVRKDGFVLEGWTLKGDTSGKVYKNGDIFELPDQDVTFVAKWKEFVPTATPSPTETPTPVPTTEATAAPTAGSTAAATATPAAEATPGAVNTGAVTPAPVISATPAADPKEKTVNGAGYTITSEREKTVSYNSIPGSKTSVSIPATVKIGKKKYKVTKIADRAFKGNKKLKKIVIGKYIKTIGKEAFSGCTKLKSITVKSKVLKKVGKNAFKGVSKKAKMTLLKKSQKKLFKKSAFKGKYLIKK